MGVEPTRDGFAPHTGFEDLCVVQASPRVTNMSQIQLKNAENMVLELKG